MREAQTNETSAAAVRVGHRSELRSLARVLSHPLLILLVGAAMSALVVPMLTNRWQEHQRALDIQTALVSDLSATATEFLFKLETLDEEVRFRPSRAVSASLATVNNRWQVNRAVIAAKLGAYYGETAIPAEWDDLSRVLSTLYLVDWSLSQQVAARQGRQPSPRGILHELLEAWNRSVTQLLRQKLHDPYPVVDFTDITAYSKVWVAAEKLRDRLVRHLLDVAPRV